MISFKTNLKFIIFILLNKIGDLFKQNTIIKNKDYSLIYYTKLFIQQKLFTKKNNKQAIPEKYIFIPLQVNTDTQVLIHSDFQDIQEFISKVEKDFYALDSTIKNDLHLVFKIHPMEKGIIKYQFDSRSFVINNDTNTLIQNSEFVITINSTVGFEALQQYKKVIVLGEAFYKISNIVIPSDKKTFLKDLKETCKNKNSINQDLINNFIKYLKYTYQINGNLFNYNIKTLNAIKNKLNKRDKK
jgi:capsule polysaccharide modification protein KpsS